MSNFRFFKILFRGVFFRVFAIYPVTVTSRYLLCFFDIDYVVKVKYQEREGDFYQKGGGGVNLKPVCKFYYCYKFP